MKLRGIIKNEVGQVIFSREGNFHDEQKCLESLHERVLIDEPTPESLIYNMAARHGGDFQSSPYCLRRHYKDISKLTFIVETYI